MTTIAVLLLLWLSYRLVINFRRANTEVNQMIDDLNNNSAADEIEGWVAR
jgi:hypothetical protein